VEVARIGAHREVVFSSPPDGIATDEHEIPKDAASKVCGWPVALTLAVDETWRSGYYEVVMEIDVERKRDRPAASLRGSVLRRFVLVGRNAGRRCTEHDLSSRADPCHLDAHRPPTGRRHVQTDLLAQTARLRPAIPRHHVARHHPTLMARAHSSHESAASMERPVVCSVTFGCAKPTRPSRARLRRVGEGTRP